MLSPNRNQSRSPNSRLAQVRDNGRGQEDEAEDPGIRPSRVCCDQETEPGRGVRGGSAGSGEEDDNEAEQVPYPVDPVYYIRSLYPGIQIDRDTDRTPR